MRLVTAPVNGVLTVGLKPGLVIVVPVDKKGHCQLEVVWTFC